MSRISNVSGFSEGMFLGHFGFEPLSNFSMIDLANIFSVMKVRYLKEEFIPEEISDHFTGLEFTPSEDLTLEELATFLCGMELRMKEDAVKKLPKDLRKHFNGTLFAPQTITFTEAKSFLKDLVRLTLETDELTSLPERTRRHFVFYNRYGDKWRYGTKWRG